MTPEEQYIGAVLAHDRVFYEHDVRVTDFTSARCRRVFDEIGRALDRDGSLDVDILLHHLPEIDKVWFASLTTDLIRNVAALARLVIDGGRRHKLSLLARETVERVNSDPVDSVIEYVETGLTDITEGREDDVVSSSDMALPMVQEFERRFRSDGVIPGITTGLADLDDILLGFEPSRYYVVGGRPSEGKSALLLHFALEALKAGKSVGFVSIESSRSELMERAFGNVGGVDTADLRRGTLGHSAMKGITDAATWLTAHPFVICDKPNMQLGEVKSRARRMVRQKGVKLLLVDYVQLIQTSGQSTDYERVSAASLGLKELSRELEIPVIAAAQLHRVREEGRPRKPRLSDFKGSGQIEQDADAAILIYRREKDGQEDVFLCVEKQRDGAKGDIQVYFDRPRMRFRGHGHE